jgi:far upstream element-binding protein
MFSSAFVFLVRSAAINNIIQDRMRDMAGGSRGGMGGMGGGMGSMGGYGPAPGMGGGGSYGNMLGGGGGGGAHRGGPEAVDLTIPNGAVGLVIGRGGATIKGIQDRAGVHVQIPKVADAHDPASRTITISGQVMHAVEEAKRMILDVVRQDAANKSGGGSGGMQMPVPSNAVIVQVPDDRVGGIIGKGGAVINEIQTRTGTHVQIPPQPEPGTSMRSVSITGNPQGCEQAKQEILAILAVSVL